jgi:hypothetical protein
MSGSVGASPSRAVWTLAIALLAAAAVFGVITLIALEGQEVVIVRTQDEHGRTHETRTWIAEDAGAVWIEAASPARPFAQHIVRSARAEIVRAGTTRAYAASIMPNPEGHERIRSLLSRKYGWADWWIGLLQDTSASIAIRLTEAA